MSDWSAMRKAGQTLGSNARFVLDEVGTLGVSDDWRRRVQDVWRDLLDAADRVATMALRGERDLMPHPLDELGWIEDGLGGRLRALDDLVQDLDRASRDDRSLAAVAILVNESGANALRACADLRERALSLSRGMAAASKSLREEADLPEGAPLVQRLSCSVCGRTAATLECGIDPSTGRRALVYSGLVRREAFLLGGAGETLAKLAEGRVAEVHGSLGAEGIDAYCPSCDRVYCSDHYRLETEYDEGFYDCTRATCPAGHKRMVDD